MTQFSQLSSAIKFLLNHAKLVGDFVGRIYDKVFDIVINIVSTFYLSL